MSLQGSAGPVITANSGLRPTDFQAGLGSDLNFVGVNTSCTTSLPFVFASFSPRASLLSLSVSSRLSLGACETTSPAF